MASPSTLCASFHPWGGEGRYDPIGTTCSDCGKNTSRNTFPRGLFDFVVGVGRWGLRAGAYAFLLVTDVYPPFSLE